MNISSMLQNQISQSYAIVPLPVVIAILVVLGLVSMIALWRRNKTAEAISLLNTVLLIIIIILLMFPPNA